MNQGERIKKLEKRLFWQRIFILAILIIGIVNSWNQYKMIEQTNDVFDNHRIAIEENIKYLNTLTDEILKLQDSVLFITTAFLNRDDLNYTIQIEIEETPQTTEHKSPIDNSQGGL